MNPVQEGLSNGPISSSSNSPINHTPTHIRLHQLLVIPVDHFDHGEALGDVNRIVCVAQDVEHLQQSPEAINKEACIYVCTTQLMYSISDQWQEMQPEHVQPPVPQNVACVSHVLRILSNCVVTQVPHCPSSMCQYDTGASSTLYAGIHTRGRAQMVVDTASLTQAKLEQSWRVCHLLQPFDLHLVGRHPTSSSLGVEQGSSLYNGHRLVVTHSKHLVEVRHGGQVAPGTAVVARDLLSQLAVLWQRVGTPGIRLLQKTQTPG